MQQFPPSPYPPQNSNRGIIVALLAGIMVLLLALVGMIAYMTGAAGGIKLNSGTSEPSTVFETQTMTRQAPQPQQQQQQPEAVVPAVQKQQTSSCNYSNYAAASGSTSGPFAANVYSAFAGACANTGGPNVSLNVYSPVTGRNYHMSCSGQSIVYCRGGDNAVVRIW